jgi:hypothetical protein
MLAATPILTQDRMDGSPHLVHSLCRAGIQRVADGGLFCTGLSSKRYLYRPVRTHPHVRLNQSTATCQNIDQAILEFVRRRMTQYLLFDVYALLNNRPDTHLLKSLPDDC